jgi:arginase
MDPDEAPGVGTPVPGGLTYREAHLAMEMASEVPFFRSLEIVEVNPLMDERNQTGELMVGLAASALGKRIL